MNNKNERIVTTQKRRQGEIKFFPKKNKNKKKLRNSYKNFTI
jgi:hypothetical protein